jgi:uncharacterized membrane protein HdeD (DUF308 family)
MSNANFFDLVRTRFHAELAELDHKRGWFIALGVFLIILGVVATGAAVATTLVSVVMLGWILLAASIGLAILSFLTGNWSGFLLTLAAAALSAIAGIAMLSNPLIGAATITLTIATILIAAGIYRAIASIAMRFPNWGWSLVNGIVTLAAGVLLVRALPTASLYFLGLLIGIDLIFHGMSWIMFGFGVHRLSGLRTRPEAPEERRAA